MRSDRRPGGVVSACRAVKRGEDGGFTLVELVVVIAILGITAVVFAAAAQQGTKVTFATSQDLTDSATDFVLSHKILEDVREATSMGTDSSPPFACAGPSGSSRVLWTSNSHPPGTETVAAYFFLAGSSSTPNQLFRGTCTDAPSASYLPIAQWLFANTDAVEVDCMPSGCGAQISVAGAAPLDLAASSLVVADLTGMPADGPFRIFVDDELMTVTDVDAGTSTLTVSRAAPATHAVGAAVRYAPDTVTIRVPLSIEADGDHRSMTLTAARRST